MTLFIIAAALTITATPAKAQLRVSVNLNIGSQPTWGPAGYDYVDYYYLPDIDVYYYVPQHQFVYLRGNRWVFASSLPARYSYYDLNHGYKVVINEPRPYLHADVYRARYARYKGWRDRQEINEHNDRYNSYHGHGNKDNDRRHGGDHDRGHHHR